MNFIVALVVAAGVAYFAYSKLGRRAGYGNTQSILPTVAVSFILSFIIVFTILKFFIKLN
jgi:threonine/homoserine efflux transporter RhtA